MQHNVYNLEDLTKVSSEIKLKSEILGHDSNNDLVWQIINSVRHQRITTKNTKNRSDASGGGKKPWRQKGTGRARAGTSRSPLWVGGGITFAHESRVCSHKVNKKMYRKAIAVLLSELKKQDKLVVVESLALPSHKTKDLKATIGKWLDHRKVLVLVEKIDSNFLMASRNLFEICYGEWQSTICPDLLFKSNLVVITKQALTEIEEWLA